MSNLEKKQGVPAGVDPEKQERCVVANKGKPGVNAYAVCNASLTGQTKKSDESEIEADHKEVGINKKNKKDKNPPMKEPKEACMNKSLDFGSSFGKVEDALVKTAPNGQWSLSKAKNPDKKADEKLGEKVEHIVEEHMLDNADAERKEGHKIMKDKKDGKR